MINANYAKLGGNYFFAEITKRVRDFAEKNPGAELIRMGIGDVTRPLAPAVAEEMERASREMGSAPTFRGYGDHAGYEFLREAICGYYAAKGVEVGADEVFVSDGSKCDAAGLLDIFDRGITALVPDPVYPAYVDSNILGGNLVATVPGNEGNGFLPQPPADARAAIMYLCSPNNPTGAVYGETELRAWIDHAVKRDGVIVYDAAYESFIRSGKPSSIFQVDGARGCAIELGSFSKMAGFTGIRCAWAVVPKELRRCGASLNALWNRRQATKYNGASYIAQRGAKAALSDEGLAQSRKNVDYYLENAALISGALAELGVWHVGGKDAPLVWLKCPDGMASFAFFDRLLESAGIVGTPGSGFGAQGEGYFRFSAFATRGDTVEAMRRLKEARAAFGG